MTVSAIPADPDAISYEFDCLRAEQPIGDLFLANVPYKTLIDITYFDVRRVLQRYRDVERYLGIQRPLNKRRVIALESYVNYFDATFPTAIIVAVKEEFASYDDKKKRMTLSNVPRDADSPTIPIRNIARVLDGQHRIAGLKEYSGNVFDLPVTIFVGADIADQAHIFATVNLEQQKVNKSLAYDLYSLAKSRSPQKTGHNVAVVLDQDSSSPFYHRIKRLGVAVEGRGFQPISQATFVEALMPYISSHPKDDCDRILRGERLKKVFGDEMDEVPFRNLFIEEKDVEIVKVLFDYYSAIKERWPIAWSSTDRGLMLNRTNGFRAFMRLYAHIYKISESKEGMVSKQFIRNYVKKIRLADKDFNTENFKPGSSGESSLLSVLRDTR